MIWWILTLRLLNILIYRNFWRLYCLGKILKKLRRPIRQEESEVVYDFLSNTAHPALISPALSSLKEAVENGDKAIIDDLLIDLSVLSDIQLKYFENEQNKFSEDGFMLFYNCKSKTDSKTHRVYLRQEALDIMKNEIQRIPKDILVCLFAKEKHLILSSIQCCQNHSVPQYLEVMKNLKSF